MQSELVSDWVTRNVAGGAAAWSLELVLRRLRPILDDQQVTEVCINRPGQAFLERQAEWAFEALEYATFEWCMNLARLVANATKQSITAQQPIVSGTLPSGERIQIVIPPATTPECVGITIRRPFGRRTQPAATGRRGIV